MTTCKSSIRRGTKCYLLLLTDLLTTNWREEEKGFTFQTTTQRRGQISYRALAKGKAQGKDRNESAERGERLHTLDHERPWRFVRFQARSQQEKQRKGSTTPSVAHPMPKFRRHWKRKRRCRTDSDWNKSFWKVRQTTLSRLQEGKSSEIISVSQLTFTWEYEIQNSRWMRADDRRRQSTRVAVKNQSLLSSIHALKETQRLTFSVKSQKKKYHT